MTLEKVHLGPRSGTRLVFLHEGLGSVSIWRDFPQRASDLTGLGAFVYSRAGYGRSPRTAMPRTVRYMHEEAALLPQILRDEGIDDAILFGHSDGASIALLHAAAAPVRGLVLEAPHVFTEPAGLASILRAREAFESGELRPRLARHHQDVEAAFWGWNGPWLDPEFRKWNLESALPAIAAPILVVQGLDDEYGTLAQVRAIESQASGPVETLLLEKCGHSPHRDRPDEVLGALAVFCAKLAASHARPG